MPSAAPGQAALVKRQGSVDIKATLLSHSKATGSSKCLTVPVRIKGKAGWTQSTALIDSGASLNCISHLLAKELELCVDAAPHRRVTTVGGTPLLSYGHRLAPLHLEDAQGRSCESEESFLAADIQGCDIILGHPWLFRHDPEVHWRQGTWQLRSPTDAASTPVSLLEPEDFLKEAKREDLTIFAIHASEDSPVRPTEDDEEDLIESGPTLRVCSATEVTVPLEYQDLEEVFSEAKANELASHGPQDHEIVLEGGNPPFGPLYSLSCAELAVLRDYIKENLAKGFIRPSSSPAGAPILFVKKKDGTLRLCVDYRGLNQVTKKNRYPLPLINETLDRFGSAKVFTKLDIRSAYNLIRVREGDEWKTAFRTRYGHFEYQVMPFGLANAPATFQSYVNDALREYLDVFCVAYMDDIVVYSENEAEHTQHVRKVLAKLLQHGLYVKLEKCEFGVTEINFVGFQVSTRGIAMEEGKVSAILEWPEPRSVRDVKAFIGFANFYRRFIRAFSALAAPLVALLKGGKPGKPRTPFVLTDEAAQAFRTLRESFTKAPVLRHFEPELPLRVECDASTIGIAAILSQQSGEDPAQRHWHPIAFYSRKLSVHEANYGVGDLEMLAIVKAFTQWRHYLGGARHQIEVASDHHNLQTFMTTKALVGRHVRWYQRLAEYNMKIVHRPGRLNPADAPSRRPDYAGTNEPIVGTPAWFKQAMGKDPPTPAEDASPQKGVEEGSQTAGGRDATHPLRPAGTDGCKRLVPQSTARVMALTETAYDEAPEERLRYLKDLQRGDPWLRRELGPEVTQRYLGVVTAGSEPVPVTGTAAEGLSGSPPDTTQESSSGAAEPALPDNWSRDDSGLFRYNDRIYLAEDGAARAQVLRTHHDDPLAGHFGVRRTAELIQRKYYWPRLHSDVKEYVSTCTLCPRVKSARHKPYGELHPLPTPKGSWTDLTMDFITGLPPSGRQGHAYDAILVVMDRFTKMACYIAVKKTIDAQGLADALMAHVISKHGIPESIVSDRGTVFTSGFWSAFCYHARIKRKLSTAFHPQTDGQTERQNQTLEQYLRSYVNHQQDDWADWLPMAEFAYNNSVHASTGYSPFQANTGRNANARFDFAEYEREVPAAREHIQRMERLWEDMRSRINDARETQARYHAKKTTPRTYAVGDMVWLAARFIHTIRPSKKLDFKHHGPYRVVEAVGAQAYRLELTGHMSGIHPVFHVSLLEPVRRRQGEELPQPSTALMEGELEDEIETILDSRVRWNRLEYLVKWVGWSDAHNEYLPASGLSHARDSVAEFHKTHPQAPGPEEPQGDHPARGAARARPRGRPRLTRSATPRQQAALAPAPSQRGRTRGSGRPRGRPRKLPDTATTAPQDPQRDEGAPRWDLITPTWLHSHLTKAQ